MSNIHQLKRRISTAKNISKITKAMEMVAASKMKRSQEQALAARPYSRALTESIRTAGSHSDISLHPLLSRHEAGIDVALVIATDKGLCGGLNTNLLKASLAWQRGKAGPKVIMVGKKGVNFARIFGLELHAQFTNLPDVISTIDVLPISSMVMEGFLNQTFRTVTVIYTDFINTLSQQTRSVQLLPLEKPEGISDPSMQVPKIEATYLFEPNPRAILDELLPFYVENTIYQSFLESKASEHSARMVAMKNASENAGELVDELRLLFNKSRQANITNELLDITTATLTLS